MPISIDQISRCFFTFFIFCCFIGCKCSKEHEYEEKASFMELVKTQKITLNLLGDPSSLHPYTGIDLTSRSLQKALFEGLTRLNPSGQPELGLADSVEISPCQTIYTFKLRPSLWSNGEKLTAQHFESAWKGGIAPDSSCIRADLFYVIKNARKAKKGELPIEEVGIKAVDESTLVVQLEHPTPYFLKLTALPLFSPLHDDVANPKVFNGPFVVQEWEHQKSLKLTKNSLYWNQDKIQLNEIFFTMVPDSNTALLMYEKGELDLVGSPFSNIPHDLLSRLEKIERVPVSGIYWISCNTKTFPLNSKYIRQALSYALNREELATILGDERPIVAPIPQEILQLDEKVSYNPELAKETFQKGLEELHLKAEEFPTLVFSHSSLPGHKNLAEAFARNWKKNLGINVELQGLEWNTFVHHLCQKQYQMGGCVYFSAFDDPVYTLDFFKDSNHNLNASQWEHQHYKQLLELADLETDLTVREEHLRQAEKMLLEEMPIIPIFSTQHRYLKKEKIKNLYISQDGLIDFTWAYLI